MTCKWDCGGHLLSCLKGYDEVQRQRAQAADEPGQVVHHVASLAVAVVGVLQEDAEAVHGVSKNDERKQEVGHPLCRLPLILRGKIREQGRTELRLFCLSHTNFTQNFLPPHTCNLEHVLVEEVLTKIQN